MKKYGGTLIFEGKDEFGPVEVVDRPKIRALHFGNPTEQSSMYLKQPFALEMEYVRTMALGMLFKPDAKKVACLGLGGAAIPKFVWKFYPEIHVSAVEISPLVIDVGQKYFHVPQDRRFKIYKEDALDFLKSKNAEHSDLIFADLYIGTGIAPAVADPEFFIFCDRCLNPGGILVWNMWRSTPQSILEECLRNLCAVFGRNLLILPNRESTNCVVMVFKEPIAPYSKREIEKEAVRLKAISEVDLPEILEHLNYFKSYGYLFQDWS